ncbi:hypothetical protein [Dactylosporangium sp. CS-033363]|uniref:hypothetical protein n=1 Tax=Dactylosporangium sp. CS-033363 TaxID=3239935 RepID=UPI003D90C5E4
MTAAVLIGPRTPPGSSTGPSAGRASNCPGTCSTASTAIVAPGTDVNPAGNYGTTPPVLVDEKLRRRGGP